MSCIIFFTFPQMFGVFGNLGSKLKYEIKLGGFEKHLAKQDGDTSRSSKGYEEDKLRTNSWDVTQC